MRNTGLEEAQAGIKSARRNINNLRYADDITLMAESKEELQSLLMKVKEESEKVDLKLNIQKMKIMASGPITAWEIMGKQWKPCQISFLGGSKTTMAGRKKLTHPLHSPPEACHCRRYLQLVPNRKRSMSRLYIGTLLI